MNRVLSWPHTPIYPGLLDPLQAERRRAVVEPGVVLDALNAKLRPLGVWYPVDVSTSAQATLGGMAGNNSCGSRSIAYGNMGWLVKDFELSQPFGVEAMARSYYMMQQLQQQYAFSLPKKIEYAAEDGRFVSPSQAHATGAIAGSRLHVVIPQITRRRVSSLMIRANAATVSAVLRWYFLRNSLTSRSVSGLRSRGPSLSIRRSGGGTGPAVFCMGAL